MLFQITTMDLEWVSVLLTQCSTIGDLGTMDSTHSDTIRMVLIHSDTIRMVLIHSVLIPTVLTILIGDTHTTPTAMEWADLDGVETALVMDGTAMVGTIQVAVGGVLLGTAKHLM